MLRTRVITGPGLYAELESSWKQLVQESPTATPFQTWEWHSTWQRFYGRQRKPIAFAFYEGEDLVGLMPMTRALGPWRTLRPSGIGPSDYLHPLARPDYEDSVAKQFVEELHDTNLADLIDLHQVRDIRPLTSAVPEGCEIEQATCLVLDLPATYEDYLQTLGKSLRYDVRKLDKSLFKEGRANVENVTSNNIQNGLDILFEQHKLRWKKRHLPGAFLGKAIQFHREWCELAVRNNWLQLGILNLDGSPIGAIYAMTLGDTTYYYQAGFDPAHGSVSPGTLLVAHTIRAAIERGQKRFDFMRGDEPYKRRWKPQNEHKNLRLVFPSRAIPGKMGAAWNVAGNQIENKIRARFEGKGLL